MINKSLFKSTIKHNYLLFLIFLIVLLLYCSIIIGMYDIENMDAINNLIALLPQSLIDAFSLGGFTDYTSYIASFFYGMIMTAFPMVYSVLLGYRLIGRMIDNSSVSLLLSTPISRTSVIVTQIVYGISSLFLLSTILSVAVISLSEIIFPGSLDIMPFLVLNVVIFLVNTIIFMISYVFSVIFNESKNMISFGAGIPIAFLLLDMLGNTSSGAKPLKYLSLFGYYDSIEIVQGSNVVVLIISYAVILMSLVFASIKIFNKRQLII